MDQRPSTESKLGAFGCLLIVMGSIFAVAGVAALWGLSPVSSDIELEFFGIDMDTTPKRLWWVLGSLVAIVVGVILIRANSRGI